MVRNQIVALEYKADGMVPVGIPVAVLIALCRPPVNDEVAVCVLIQSADDIQHRGFACLLYTSDAADE